MPGLIPKAQTATLYEEVTLVAVGPTWLRAVIDTRRNHLLQDLYHTGIEFPGCYATDIQVGTVHFDRVRTGASSPVLPSFRIDANSAHLLLNLK